MQLKTACLPAQHKASIVSQFVIFAFAESILVGDRGQRLCGQYGGSTESKSTVSKLSKLRKKMQLSLAKSADGWCVRCTASESSNEHRVHYRHVEDHTRRRRSLCFSGKWEVIRSSSTQQPLTLLAPSVHRYFSTSPSFAPFLICCAPVVRLRTALLLPSHLWNSTYSECSDWTSVLPCVLQHSGCVTDCHCRHCVPIRYSYRGHQTKLVFSNCFALFLSVSFHFIFHLQQPLFCLSSMWSNCY